MRFEPRQALVVVITTLSLLTASIGTALADTRNVGADCGPGGYFYSSGTVSDYQKHTHNGSSIEWSYSGLQTKTKNWGWQTLWESATLESPWVFSSASARCLG